MLKGLQGLNFAAFLILWKNLEMNLIYNISTFQHYNLSTFPTIFAE